MSALRRLLLSCLLLSAATVVESQNQTATSSGSLLNTPAPDINFGKLLQAPQAAATNLNSLKGKIVVLEFWATWCAPCVAALPHLNDISEKFKDQILFVSITDEDEQKVLSFLQRRPIRGWVALDIKRAAFNAFLVNGIPDTVIIDREGKIAAVTNPSELNEGMLDTILTRKQLKGESEELKRPIADQVSVQGAENGATRLNIIIKPTRSIEYSSTTGRGKFSAIGIDLRTALSLIYDIPETRIIGPSVLQDARYDISASMIDDKNGALIALLRKAMETSFGMSVHRETREMEVLVLTAPEHTRSHLTPSNKSKSKLSTAPGVMIGIGQDIQVLVDGIEHTLGLPVLNETTLQGRYDWEILFDKDDPPSIVSALRKALDLEAKRTKRAVEVLVVEIH